MRQAGPLLILMTLAAVPASAQTNWGLAITPANDLIFCDQRRDRVSRLDRAGELSVVLPATHCRGVASSATGLVYGESVSAGTRVDASSGQSRDFALGVWRVGAGGTMGWLQPPKSAPDPGVWIVVDRDGRSFGWTGQLPRSASSQIVRREPSGVTSVVAGGTWGIRDGIGLNAGFGRVGAMAFAPDGSLVVADSGNIRRLSPNGRLKTESVGTVSDPDAGVVGRTGLWDRTIGLAVGTDGSAIVVDTPAGRIVRVQRDGLAAEIWRSRRGWRPTGVALLESGFYVMEDLPVPELLADLIGSPRIRLMRADGSTQPVYAVANWTVRLLVALAAVILLSAAARARRRSLGSIM